MSGATRFNPERVSASFVPSTESSLPKDSVANVTQVVTLDQDYLLSRAGRVAPGLMARVDAGLKLVLDL